MTPATIFAVGTAVGVGGGALIAQNPLKGALIGGLVGAIVGGAAAGVTAAVNQGFLNIGKLGAPGVGAAQLQQLQPTRASCIECVQKHLGAAMVLLAEVRDGYPHRLRAIGHLHEAEDESQAWPELHDSIRHARKEYALHNNMPDWAMLETMVNTIRQST